MRLNYHNPTSRWFAAGAADTPEIEKEMLRRQAASQNRAIFMIREMVDRKLDRALSHAGVFAAPRL
jgi:hypothetical protein